jgi:hypothetical protein
MNGGARQQGRKTMLGLSGGSWSRRTLNLPGGLYFAASSNPSWAQRPDTLKSFTAPDGTFSFRHSNQLIQCQQTKQADGGYSWIPTENCVAYFPVCDDEIAQDSTPIACFAYTRDKFTNTESFEAATFSVEVLNQAATEKDCLTKPSDEIFVGRGNVKIQGVTFAVFEFREGGISQGVGGHIYRAFHQGKCYQLGINEVTATAQTFDPPARELTKDDWRQVEGSLEQARDSFRFLK